MTATRSLPAALRTDGSAIFHLLRNVGSSIGVSLEDIRVVDPATSPEREKYAHSLWTRRQRKGLSLAEANQLDLEEATQKAAARAAALFAAPAGTAEHAGRHCG